jgi:competence protein ComFC
MMKKCLLCNRYLNVGLDLSFILSFKKVVKTPICTQCTKKFASLADCKTCIKCGKISTVLECRDCQKWNDQLVNKAMYQYNEPMREFFQRYKFQGDYLLRKVFQDQFINFIQKILKEDEIIIPVPVDHSTMNLRGFNQVTGLIEELEFQDVLTNQRSRKSLHQFQRSRKERLQQKNSFQLKENVDIAGRQVLLVDDIYTTGATLRHAMMVLKQSGAQKVRSVTLCR